ncbi:Cytochrome c3 [uncultured archaeon]|nr:Cytochrome c3 [uncultured archaeon]
MEKSHRLFIGILIGLTIVVCILLAFYAQKNIGNPLTCNYCHEMKPFVESYLKPDAMSIISKHDLDCLGCHTNTSLNEAKSAIAEKIEAGVLNKIIGVNFNTTSNALAVNCRKCHIMNDYQHLSIPNNTLCTNCHWAHNPREATRVIGGLIIPSGFHVNRTCQFCHNASVEVPRCTKCHTGHGEVKFENSLCLGCHMDPHFPKKPGILPNNTVKFKGDLPFFVCQPCHKNEYFTVTNSASKHTGMGTCTKCHVSHGQKPSCDRNCHQVMSLFQHPITGCDNCHKGFNPVRITCYDCHGNNAHDIQASNAVLNPK